MRNDDGFRVHIEESAAFGVENSASKCPWRRPIRHDLKQVQTSKQAGWIPIMSGWLATSVY